MGHARGPRMHAQAQLLRSSGPPEQPDHACTAQPMTAMLSASGAAILCCLSAHVCCASEQVGYNVGAGWVQVACKLAGGGPSLDGERRMALPLQCLGRAARRLDVNVQQGHLRRLKLVQRFQRFSWGFRGFQSWGFRGFGRTACRLNVNVQQGHLQGLDSVHRYTAVFRPPAGVK